MGSATSGIQERKGKELSFFLPDAARRPLTFSIVPTGRKLGTIVNFRYGKNAKLSSLYTVYFV